MRRPRSWAPGLAIALVGLAGPTAAAAKDRGTDLLANVSPESQVSGGLADRFPLSAYGLDYHVDVGVFDPGGVAPMIAQWAAAQLWSVTSLLVKTVIDLFTWAFSLDLLGGTDGALEPIAQAITSLYENVIGQAWMVAAILVAGLWGIWKALVQRRYTETAGGLAVSVVFVVVALFFVYQPQRTVGQASRWTNTLSLAFLSGANRGSLDDPAQAKRQVADHLFETLVYRPWVVLEFGGLSHCVDTDRTDGDGFPRPVGPHDPTRDICRDHLRAGRDGHGGYAPRYLRQAPGSAARKAEYDALRTGEAPANDPQFAGYRVDKADAPAVDMQQAGGAFQRLTFAVVVFAGALGAVALLGFLSLAVILAQVVALVLLGFAPVALLVGIFPGTGHAFFRGWLARLATAVFIKALYSLVLAIVVAVSAALAGSTGSLGFLFAFGLQTIFFWAIFLYRRQITARLVGAATGGASGDRLPRLNVVQRGAHAATRPVHALVGVTRRGGEAGERRVQESALAGGEATRSHETSVESGSASGVPVTPAVVPVMAPAGPSANGTRPRPPVSASIADRPHVGGSSGTGGNGAASAPVSPTRPSVTGAPASDGRGRPPAPGPGRFRVRRSAPRGSSSPALTNGAGSQAAASNGRVASPPATPVRVTADHPAVERRVEAPEPTPRASHEDVMRRARELRERARAVGLGDQERGG